MLTTMMPRGPTDLRALHEADVSRVQITHRRHQSNAHAGATPLEREPLHGRNVFHHLHQVHVVCAHQCGASSLERTI